MEKVITLYHFCCDRDMPGIRSQGITKGEIVGEKQNKFGKWGRVEFLGWQWLTYDKNRDRQSWATRKLIKYSRTEYRFTVEIPEKEVSQLYDRDRLAEEIWLKSQQGPDGLPVSGSQADRYRIHFRGKAGIFPARYSREDK